MRETIQPTPESSSVENGQYVQPKAKKKNRFWGVITIVVLVGVVLLIIWTFFTRGNDSQDSSSLTASSISSTTTFEENNDPSQDPDSDGLTNKQEEQYGTNPSESDTDKDGFSDGEEIKNGYNPNGPGRLEVEGETGSLSNNQDSNQQQSNSEAEFTGVPLDQVFSGSGESYICSITGGTTEVNTVTLNVKGDKIRQETPVNGETLVMIVDGTTFYMSGFKGGKFIKLNYDPEAGVATGEGAQVKNGIFTSEKHILNTHLVKVDCQQELVPDSVFTVSEDLLVNP